jgi:ATP-binding cassette subfamily C protein LapB
MTLATPTPTADVAPDAARQDDPLAECLHIITRLHGRAISANALVAGLPAEKSGISPQTFVRAAERNGYTARIVKRPLKKISKLLLPAVLILKDGGACVLTDLPSRKTAKVMFPEAGFGTTSLELDALDRQCSGYVIFVQPEFGLDDSRLSNVGRNTSKSWFWGTLWRYRRYYGEAILAAAIVNLLTVATSLFIMNVYDRVVPNNATETLTVLAIGTAMAIGFEFLARNLRAYFLDSAGKKADLVLASTLFAQALGTRIESRPPSSGAFAAQLREFESLRDFMSSATLTAVIDLPFVAFFIWVIFLIGGPVYLVPSLAVPAVFLAGLIAQVPLAYLMRQHLREAALKHGLLVEAVDGMEILKTLCAEGGVQGRYEDYTALTSRSATRSRMISSLVVNFAMLATQLTTILIVVWGVFLIAEGQLTVGALIACVILSGRGLAPLQQVASLMTRYQSARASYGTLNELMQRPVERPASRQFLERPTVDGAIALEQVRFAYPNKKLEVINNVSLSIAAGEHVGVLGRIGSGKSTLLKLILGLYSPGAGAIRIDGVDIEQFDPIDIRHQMGYVAQDTRLFQGSLRDNITMGFPHAQDAEVLEAARLAGLDKIVAQQPDGFETIVGERGDGLSGGQRQAVAIARALIKKPSVLLLDEPTSAMDHSAEQSFIANVGAFAEQRTLVLVTHKPTLLNLVSRLIVMDGGRVVMDGPRDDVLKQLTQPAGGAKL